MSDFELSNIKGLSMMGKGEFSKRLKELNITNVYDLVCRSTEELVTTTKIKQESIEKIKLRAMEYLKSKDLLTNMEMTPREQLEYDRLIEKTTISIGVNSIDTMLKGGIKKGKFYTIYGPEGCGKTQFCHNAVVQALNQTDGDVFWLEVENTFDPERIIQICVQKLGISEDKALEYLDRINIQRCPDSLLIMKAIDNLTNSIIDNNIGLIIIDGAPGQFRLDFVGMGDLSNRQKELKTFVNRLKRITSFFDIPFIMSNQVYESPNPMGITMYKQVGGRIVGHVSTHTFQIGKKGTNRLLKYKKGPSEETEVEFKITDKGLEDVVKREKKNEEDK